MKQVTLYSDLEINTTSQYCILDGKKYKTKNGVWTFYIPKIQTKWFHALNQKVSCVREKIPQCYSDIQDSTDYGVYSADEWRSVFSESIYTKAAANYIIIEKLYEHDLGPKPLGLSLVKRVSADNEHIGGPTAGVEVENIQKLKSKCKTTEQDIHKAGIITDKINSALRQQIKGYVSDLNSVVSVSMQIHDPRVEDLAQMLQLSHAMIH